MCKNNNRLKQFFPLIRERWQILADIENNQKLRLLYNSWSGQRQEELLDFCTGVKGVKMTYDSFLKEVMNPEFAPARLEAFLSAMLKKKVKILMVLPNDSVRIAAESTLLITDLVVQLEDGSIANIEIQKIGYMFPGERAACYSADLLLRQYKRVRDERQKKFSYKDIKPVYTIVLFENSPGEFHNFPDTYLHYLEPESDTGIRLNLLQKYLFISLDIFKRKHQNKLITNKVDAWLTFLSMDRPEDIINLITSYPEFKPMYDDIYHLCLNTERVMNMFSKELQKLDENTVQYMMDEMQDRINKLEDAVTSQAAQLTEKEDAIALQTQQLTEKENEILKLQQRIRQLEQEK